MEMRTSLVSVRSWCFGLGGAIAANQAIVDEMCRFVHGVLVWAAPHMQLLKLKNVSVGSFMVFWFGRLNGFRPVNKSK